MVFLVVTVPNSGLVKKSQEKLLRSAINNVYLKVAFFSFTTKTPRNAQDLIMDVNQSPFKEQVQQKIKHIDHKAIFH